MKRLVILVLAMVVLFFSSINCYATDMLRKDFVVGEDMRGWGIEEISKAHSVSYWNFLKWNKKYKTHPGHIQVGDKYRIFVEKESPNEAVAATEANSIPDVAQFSEMDFADNARVDKAVSIADIVQFVKAKLTNDLIIKSIQVVLIITPGGVQTTKSIGEASAVTNAAEPWQNINVSFYFEIIEKFLILICLSFVAYYLIIQIQKELEGNSYNLARKL